MAIGTEAEQLSRLAHLKLVHGLAVERLCPGCVDAPDARDCKACGGDGHTFRIERPEPCGPDCPIHMVFSN